MKTIHSKIRNNRSVGIFTYDFFHLKTEQIVHKLLRNGWGGGRITLFALPFSQRPQRQVLIPHRPNQVDSITTEDLALANNISFVRYDGKSELDGAGLLPSKIVKNKKIINCHPGIIPSARGLDSFKCLYTTTYPLASLFII